MGALSYMPSAGESLYSFLLLMKKLGNVRGAKSLKHSLYNTSYCMFTLFRYLPHTLSY